MGRRDAYTGFLWGNEGKKPLGRPRCRWEDNIKTHLQWCMDWIDLAQNRDRWKDLVNVVMNLRVPENARNFLTSCELVSFSRTLLHEVSKQARK
jgi:hypothetical protein